MNYVKKPHRQGALLRLSNYLNDSEKKIVFNSTVKSKFSYCPLIWILCSRTLNIMINKVHEGALTVVLNDHTSDFKTLLQNKNDGCNHYRNTQTLLIQIFNSKNVLAPPIMESVLKKGITTDNLRYLQEFETEKKKNCTISFSNNKLPFFVIMLTPDFHRR